MTTTAIGLSTKDVTRFWSRVQVGGETECWRWQAGTNEGRGNGYGIVCLGGKKCYTHRTAYELTHGEIPDGLFVCHRCDVPTCCNPNHLFLGTNKENIHDALKKGRKWGAPSGERNGRTRLTDAQAAQIQALRQSGALAAGKHNGSGTTSLAKVARTMGVSANTVRYALRRTIATQEAR